MIEHNPHNVAGHLRDHLATHDKPLVFFFGAGTSAAIKVVSQNDGTEKPLIPVIAALTETCKQEVEGIGAPYKAAWAVLCSECDQLGLPQNVENILSRIRAKINAMGPEDTSCGLSRDELHVAELEIAKIIVRESSPNDDLIPQDCPHDVFARWIARTSRQSPIEVFTTNYDILIERSLEKARVPVFDGFIGSHKPFFAPEIVEDSKLMPPPEWVRVWKLHGSINWSISDSHGTPQIVRGGLGDPQLILPSQLKYVESRKEPYLALIDRLSKSLRRDGTLLVSVGFSFSDQHLNNIILDALDSNPLTHLICLAYGSLESCTELREQARKRKNIMIIARDGAIVGGQDGIWSRSDSTTVFRASDKKDQEANGSGEMLLGDFEVFAKFLSEMDPSIANSDE